MQLLCEHPVIIRNPELKNLLIKHRSYTFGSAIHTITWQQSQWYKYRFPEWLFSPRKTGVTLETIDNYQVLNVETGEAFPMYMQVPCGKCVLCRSKKQPNGPSVLRVKMCIQHLFLYS